MAQSARTAPCISPLPVDMRASGDSGPAPRSSVPAKVWAPQDFVFSQLRMLRGAGRDPCNIPKHPTSGWHSRCCPTGAAPCRSLPHPPALILTATAGCPLPCISLLSKSNFCSCKSPFPGRFHHANSLRVPKSRGDGGPARFSQGEPPGCAQPLAHGALGHLQPNPPRLPYPNRKSSPRAAEHIPEAQ